MEWDFVVCFKCLVLASCLRWNTEKILRYINIIIIKCESLQYRLYNMNCKVWPSHIAGVAGVCASEMIPKFYLVLLVSKTKIAKLQTCAFTCRFCSTRCGQNGNLKLSYTLLLLLVVEWCSPPTHVCRAHHFTLLCQENYQYFHLFSTNLSFITLFYTIQFINWHIDVAFWIRWCARRT